MVRIMDERINGQVSKETLPVKKQILCKMNMSKKEGEEISDSRWIEKKVNETIGRKKH